jgi:hypothetical protein
VGFRGDQQAIPAFRGGVEGGPAAEIEGRGGGGGVAGLVAARTGGVDRCGVSRSVVAKGALAGGIPWRGGLAGAAEMPGARGEAGDRFSFAERGRREGVKKAGLGECFLVPHGRTASAGGEAWSADNIERHLQLRGFGVVSFFAYKIYVRSDINFVRCGGLAVLFKGIALVGDWALEQIGRSFFGVRLILEQGDGRLAEWQKKIDGIQKNVRSDIFFVIKEELRCGFFWVLAGMGVGLWSDLEPWFFGSRLHLKREVGAFGE